MSGEQRAEGPGAGALVLAFLAGALVGAAGALLLAPRSGVDARARLAGAAGGARERGRRIREAARAAAVAAQAAFEEALQNPNAAPTTGPESAMSRMNAPSR
jgi:gas vesicle protein